MFTKQQLIAHHKSEEKTIKNRLKEFKTRGEKLSDKEVFLELSFCLCTPQSKALKVAEVIHTGNLNKILTLNESEMAKFLQKNTRFHNTKAKNIVLARQFIKDLKKLDKNPIIAREFLVKNIRGLGYKESSHFLRNIGYRNICIVDRHVINLMHELKVLENNIPPSTPKKYLEIEEKIKKFAREVKMDVDELDLALWSYKTGEVFK